ncbi:hypothetical protein GCM10018773_56910 [Streptomyces candidus]|nr:hypothetical protein GCM10018773_56910 [Streptomyces candidus]
MAEGGAVAGVDRGAGAGVQQLGRGTDRQRARAHRDDLQYAVSGGDAGAVPEQCVRERACGAEGGVGVARGVAPCPVGQFARADQGGEGERDAGLLGAVAERTADGDEDEQKSGTPHDRRKPEPP